MMILIPLWPLIVGVVWTVAATLLAWRWQVAAIKSQANCKDLAIERDALVTERDAALRRIGGARVEGMSVGWAARAETSEL